MLQKIEVTTCHPGLARTCVNVILKREINEQVRPGELDLLFRVFDTNKDGFLQLGEIVRQQERLQPSLGKSLASATL